MMRTAVVPGAVLLMMALVGSAPATGATTAQAARASTSVPAASAAASTADAWHLAPSLRRLRAEIDARWPGRSRVSDGALGDRRHTKSRNSHNPVGGKNGPANGTTGAVHALDITASGIDVATVLRALIGDQRVWYVIHDGRIWSRTTSWRARVQPGDPHRTHIHVSLRDVTPAVAKAAEKDTSQWLPSPQRATKAGRSSGLSTLATRVLQKALIARGYRIPSGPTGWYGPETTKAVRAFQRDQGWSGSGADGKAGATTLQRLGVKATLAAASAAAKAKAAKIRAAKVRAAKVRAAKVRAAKIKAAKLRSAKAAKAKAAKAKAAKSTKAARTAKAKTAKARAAKAAKARAAKTKATTKTKAAKARAAKAKAAKIRAAKIRAAKVRAAKARAVKAAQASAAKARAAAAKAKAAKAAKAKAAGAYQPGTASREVYFLQEALIKRGYRIPAGPTGYFGPKTVEAVKAFQLAQGWRGAQADGVPGKGTLQKLGLATPKNS